VEVLQIRLKIYRYALNGYCQRKIASLLCISRQNVYYHIKELVKNRYLVCKNPHGSPKIYGPTDKSYNPHKESKKNQRGGRQICRIHCIAYKCPIIDVSSYSWKRWNNWKSFRNNGTIFFQKKWNTDLGRVTFRIIKGKDGSNLVFWLPEKYLDKHQFGHWKDIEPRYVRIFYDEFQKRYDCTLGELSRYQKPEYAFPEDPDFLFLADKYNLSSGNAWVDSSEGSPEWETNEQELAKAKIEMPERLLRLENNVSRLLDNFERVEVKLDRLNGLFSGPDIPDSRRDVV